MQDFSFSHLNGCHIYLALSLENTYQRVGLREDPWITIAEASHTHRGATRLLLRDFKLGSVIIYLIENLHSFSKFSQSLRYEDMCTLAIEPNIHICPK